MRLVISVALVVTFVIAGFSVYRDRASNTDRVLARVHDAGGLQAVTLLSRVHTIDKIYHSMQGPRSNQEGIRLLQNPSPELLWATGMRCELVASDGQSEISREFFCHSNLVLNQQRPSPLRAEQLPTGNTDGRIFTLVPGQMAITLPAGFGIPIYSDERLDYFSMSLNLNVKDHIEKVRFKTTINFIKDSERKGPMRPLFRRSVYAYEPVGVDSPHAMCQSSDHPGASCGPFIGQAASNAFLQSLGKSNTVHWMVPPGRYESHVPVTDQLELPCQTTLHFAAAHLHPFGKSISLRDRTSGQTLFTINSKDFADRLGVACMEQRVFTEGLTLYTDHDYELITIYDNTTATPVDAMSILYLYALDKKFEQRMRSTAGGTTTVSQLSATRLLN